MTAAIEVFFVSVLPCGDAYSLALLLRPAAVSLFTSSGVSFGRSMVSVIFPIFPVKANGTW